MNVDFRIKLKSDTLTKLDEDNGDTEIPDGNTEVPDGDIEIPDENLDEGTDNDNQIK